MVLPLRITFHNMPHSDRIEAKVREEATRLESFYKSIIGCRVVVDLPHRHRRDGNPYKVRIYLTVPGEEIVVNREASLHSTQQQRDAQKRAKQAEPEAPHKHVDLAISEAFDTARRLLQDYARRQRREVKSHEPAPHARVVKIVPEDDYGMIATPDGREFYFHRNSVLNDGFDRIEVGTEVTFVEELGEKGPQASTVRPAGRQRPEKAEALWRD